MATLRALRARPVLVPIRRPPVSASGAIPKAALVLFDLETDEGVTGRSYVFGFAPWTLASIVGCAQGLFEMIKGDELAPLDLEAKLRGSSPCSTRTAWSGWPWPASTWRPGTRSPRRAGCRSSPCWAGRPARFPRTTAPASGSSRWRRSPTRRRRCSAEGFRAIKLRVGRDDFAQDLAAVRAVKKRIGDGATLMCDFNQRLTVNEGIRRARALDGEGLYWIEEPLRHDDYEGYARIAAEVATPIQTGENLVDTFEMARAIALRSLDFVMPDVQRIGGVSGWLRAAALAHAHGVDMSSHLFPEFSVHLLGVTPTCHWLEYMDWAAPLLQEPLRVKDGVAQIPDRPGAGIPGTRTRSSATRPEAARRGGALGGARGRAAPGRGSGPRAAPPGTATVRRRPRRPVTITRSDPLRARTRPGPPARPSGSPRAPADRRHRTRIGATAPSSAVITPAAPAWAPAPTPGSSTASNTQTAPRPARRAGGASGRACSTARCPREAAGSGSPPPHCLSEVCWGPWPRLRSRPSRRSARTTAPAPARWRSSGSTPAPSAGCAARRATPTPPA